MRIYWFIHFARNCFPSRLTRIRIPNFPIFPRCQVRFRTFHLPLATGPPLVSLASLSGGDPPYRISVKMQSTLIKFSLQIDSLPADFHFAFSFRPLSTHCVLQLVANGGAQLVRWGEDVVRLHASVKETSIRVWASLVMTISTRYLRASLGL